ncbi:MAG TPA: hypothetical protein VGF72_08695 [Gaiellaceae bacterium]
MKSLPGIVLLLAAGTAGLTLAAGAAGGAATSSPQIRRVTGSIEALAVDGSRIAYDVGSTTGKTDNKVLVWNVGTGKTTTVSGKHTRTADTSSTGSGVFELALAGSRVAWLVNVGGNLEGDDYLFASSVTKPKERKLVTETREGDTCPGRQSDCAGEWLGGLVGSGSLIAVNRWTTDGTGAVTNGGLYALDAATTKQIAAGSDTVEAASVDRGRVVVLRSDGTVGMYSSSGDLLRTVAPSSTTAVALSGHNLVVLTKERTLELYYAPSGSPSRTFFLRGSQTPRNLDVQGEIAIYSVGGAVHALDLGSGKDRVIGKLGGGIGFARISSAGVVYSNIRVASRGTLVFVPLRRVTAAVG